ncbi:uncharacterized protein LOC134721431 isoform X4 [Mytilus trossulus]|uniref:uncharacterized protein LOC134721431 isoform X4 n=1 Tax=Mytilus trossulus TaxID=6551 RepID=UPI003007397E
MSSYILGDDWPIKPSWKTMYRKESTYRHDYNKGKAPEYDRHGMIRNMDYNKTKFEDPMWQRGRNESSEQYEDRLREMSKHQAPDYYPTYEARKAHEMHEYGRERRPQHDAYHDGPMTDRRGNGDMDRGRGYEDGSQTDRRHDRRDDPKSKKKIAFKLPHIQDGQYGFNLIGGPFISRYDRYRPTQKDYGDFETTPKLDNMPKPYRGQFDKQNPGQKNVEQRLNQQPPDSYRSGQHTDRYHDERGRPEYRQEDHDRRGEPQKRRDLDRIEMHEGNFKPYASNYYQDKLNTRNPVREQNLSHEISTHAVPPPHIDYKSTGNIEPVSRPESGVYLFIRTHKDALSDIKTSFQKHKTMLNQSGMLTGISTRVRITGDYSNWQLKRGPAFEDHGVTEYDTDYIVIVLWFPNAKAAKYWIDYDKDFKGASFPAPYGRDMVIVPINYIPPEDGSCRTFLLTEYPAVKHPDYFRTDIIEPMRDILRDYNCEPFVVRTNNASVDRSSWIGTGSTLAVHRFPNDTEAQRFLTDPRARNLRGKLNGVTKGGRHTTVKFTITDLV